MVLKVSTVVLALICWITSATAEVVLNGDRGGRIGTYVNRANDLRSSGESIRVAGLCASACTILVAAALPGRVCVTPQASLGFHSAWDYDGNGQPVVNPEATQLLMALYTPHMRAWVRTHGGLTPRMIFLQGRELQRMFPLCKQTATYARY
ncbi:MAG TPA: hypothetical protein VMU25_04770 [Candidatus Paceibacterota bacterium]|nr:hypothetical protein [Candidatus Paceibacterota bacterium]